MLIGHVPITYCISHENRGGQEFLWTSNPQACSLYWVVDHYLALNQHLRPISLTGWRAYHCIPRNGERESGFFQLSPATNANIALAKS